MITSLVAGMVALFWYSCVRFRKNKELRDKCLSLEHGRIGTEIDYLNSQRQTIDTADNIWSILDKSKVTPGNFSQEEQLKINWRNSEGSKNQVVKGDRYFKSFVQEVGPVKVNY